MSATRTSLRLRLQHWLKEAEISLHPSLEIVGAEDYRILAVGAIEPQTTVARIPKRAILSQRTTSAPVERLGSDLPPPVRLAVVLLHEQSLGSVSPWFDYIASLPTEIVPIASLWPTNGEARDWARGTALDVLLRESALNLTSLELHYETTVRPFFLDISASPPSLDQFLHAYSIVSSRAFQSDQWHGLSLVPLADLFNHSDDNHVDFRSEMWVCAECGSFDSCEHDEGGLERSVIQPAEDQRVEDDMCELVSVTRIEEGQEVFNTYGDLSNAHLLLHYGFALDANKYDEIILDLQDVLGRAPTPAADSTYLGDWDLLLDEWHRAPSPSDTMDGLLVDGPSTKLIIDADARISRSLWLLLIALHVPLPSTAIKRLDLIAKMDQIQTARHEGVYEVQKPLIERALVVLAEAICKLCSLVMAQHKGHNRTGEELLELAATQTDPRTRMAIELQASERQVLEATIHNWQEISWPSREDE